MLKHKSEDVAGSLRNGVDERSARRLAGRLLKVHDDERRRIARELHDTMAQNLAALSMNFTLLSAAIAGKKRTDGILAECGALTGECLKQLRSVSCQLHPPLLDELGLTPALRSFVQSFEQRTGVSVDWKAEPFPRLEPELELTVFRIVQEALLNMHRHSGCDRCEVRLTRSGRLVEVAVRDWGKGFAVPPRDGLGIAGMRERARGLGGRLEILPADPGTLVRAAFPAEP